MSDQKVRYRLLSPEELKDNPLYLEYQKERSELIKKVNQRKKLTVSETVDYCTDVAVDLVPGVELKSCETCIDYLFVLTYLTYYHDITGGGKYYKYSYLSHVRTVISRAIVTNNITFDDFSEHYFEVPREVAQADLEYLYKESDKWDDVILKENHSDQVLQFISNETRKLIRENLDRDFENEPYGKGSNRYKFQRISILLRSKYQYHQISRILEEKEQPIINFDFNGTNIHLTPKGFVHVFYWHFMKASLMIDVQKTFHVENFEYSEIEKFILEVLRKISKTNVANKVSLSTIIFRYIDTPYKLHTTPVSRKKKGGVTERFSEITSFYPILDQELQNLSSYKIDDKLTLFLKPDI
ncbi:hypothetical protein [Siphonobacter aquaeclarae]|uniref:Uncharacterized protein n=1 Tax=Siphonobacter aquaeclarae TaxID=563176 RepID=A0A1G9T2F1_9BACT|nr:hypothetical protein [Siphonobacter aquaeclarae]SDM41806.1 hypothetical protein SAMN04488090_3385 [Siphonobacter aquaeclarae]